MDVYRPVNGRAANLIDQRLLIEHGLLVACAAGVGLSAAGISNLLLARFFDAVYTFNLPKIKTKSTQKINQTDVIGAVLGALFMFILSLGTVKVINLTLLGFLSGYLLSYLIRKQLVQMKKWIKQREIIILFEAVELYMRAGLTMPHALQAAKLLTPSIRSAINRALVYWPSGSAKALEVFRQEIDLPEADILASLLVQIEKAGINNLEGVIQREAERLQRMREAAERAEISRRPTYMMLYRGLPLISALGMVAGVLFMHVGVTLRSAGIAF